MSWNGHPVIDLDAHIVERADRFYRAYHRWVADFCAQAPRRLKWTIVANMRDVQRPGLTDQSKRKILSENALRLCPRLRA